MIVYALKRCEEYWMQDDAGLYATAEGAVKAVGPTLLRKDDCGTVILITVDSEHYANPNVSKVVASDGVEITLENVEDYLYGFNFYDITHGGYNVWGVFAVEVND